jgi:integrase
MAKLFKRGRTYYGWVPKRGGGFRPVSTGCSDKSAAAIVHSRLEREAVDPDHAASSAQTVDLLDDLLRSLTRKERSAATLSFTTQKAGHLRRLLPARADAITHRVLEGFADRRIEEGAARATVKKELGVLRQALRLARRNGLFRRDPAEVLPDVQGDYVPRTRALTRWELVALLHHLEPARGAHVAFIVATATRWGESVRAQREDIGPQFVRVRGTKTVASAASVPILPMFRPMLGWSLERAPGKVGEPLFREWLGVTNSLARACRRTGIAPVTANDLRRTQATWLRAAGVEPQLIGAQLRHTTSRMTELVYGKLPAADLGRLLTERTGRGESLMRGPSVVDENPGALWSPGDPQNPAEESGQGRNRTGDTRISNPVPIPADGLPEGALEEATGRAEGLMRARLVRRGFWLTARSWFRRAA